MEFVSLVLWGLLFVIVNQDTVELVVNWLTNVPKIAQGMAYALEVSVNVNLVSLERTAAQINVTVMTAANMVRAPMEIVSVSLALKETIVRKCKVARLDVQAMVIASTEDVTANRCGWVMIVTHRLSAQENVLNAEYASVERVSVSQDSQVLRVRLVRSKLLPQWHPDVVPTVPTTGNVCWENVSVIPCGVISFVTNFFHRNVHVVRRSILTHFVLGVDSVLLKENVVVTPVLAVMIVQQHLNVMMIVTVMEYVSMVVVFVILDSLQSTAKS